MLMVAHTEAREAIHALLRAGIVPVIVSYVLHEEKVGPLCSVPCTHTISKG